MYEKVLKKLPFVSPDGACEVIGWGQRLVKTSFKNEKKKGGASGLSGKK